MCAFVVEAGNNERIGEERGRAFEESAAVHVPCRKFEGDDVALLLMLVFRLGGGLDWAYLGFVKEFDWDADSGGHDCERF